MGKREKPPAPMVEKSAHGFMPVTAYDAELLIADPVGTEYDLVKRTRRSWPQLKLYWSMLNRIVKATGKWPTAEKLHRDIKLTLGYVEQSVNLRTGETTLTPDSVAFDAMTQDEFQIYFNHAVELLAEKLRFDPLAFIEAGERRRAA